MPVEWPDMTPPPLPTTSITIWEMLLITQLPPTIKNVAWAGHSGYPAAVYCCVLFWEAEDSYNLQSAWLPQPGLHGLPPRRPILLHKHSRTQAVAADSIPNYLCDGGRFHPILFHSPNHDLPSQRWITATLLLLLMREELFLNLLKSWWTSYSCWGTRCMPSSGT